MRKTARPVVWEGGGAQSPSPDPIPCVFESARTRFGGTGVFAWCVEYDVELGASDRRTQLVSGGVDHLLPLCGLSVRTPMPGRVDSAKAALLSSQARKRGCSVAGCSGDWACPRFRPADSPCRGKVRGVWPSPGR